MGEGRTWTAQSRTPTSLDPSPHDSAKALDFLRFLSLTPQSGPAPGVPYERLLAIATEVCRRRIRDLTKISKRDLNEIKRRLREEKRNAF